MRTLTIGVVIVTGGTLAALPFRRTPSPEPGVSTMPLVSSSDISLLASPDDVPSPSEFAEQLVPDGTAPGLQFSEVPAPAWPADALPSFREQARGHVATEAPRPLTYRDYAIDMAVPKGIQERFSATVSEPRKAADRPTVPTREFPLTSSAAAAAPDVVEPVEQAADRTSQTSLASNRPERQAPPPTLTKTNQPPTDETRIGGVQDIPDLPQKETQLTSERGTPREPGAPEPHREQSNATRWISSKRRASDEQRARHWIQQPNPASENRRENPGF